MAPSRQRPEKPPRLRGLGLGAELAAALVGFTLVGVWIDQSFDTTPWGTLISVTVGLVGGFYNFIRQSLRELNPPSFHSDRRDRDERNERQD